MGSRRFQGLQDLPRLDGGGDLPRPLADARQARVWVQSLPRANAHTTLVRLRDMLHALLLARLPPQRRLQVLEELRVPVLEAIAHLEREFVGGALPLPPARARAVQEAEALHLMLGHGYRLAAVENCRRSGKPPLFGAAPVAKALERALYHYSNALLEAWRVYRQPAQSAWQGLHRGFWFAEEHRLADRAVEDAQMGGHPTARALYVRALLIALANPYSFSQSEQADLCQVAEAFAPLCTLSHARPEGQHASVPDDADLPPGLDPEQHHGPWLEITPLATAVAAALATAGEHVVDLSPRGGRTARIGRDALVRLQRSLGQAAARGHARLHAQHRVEAVIGLSGLHYFLAGGLDFEAFVRQCTEQTIHIVDRATWAQGGEHGRVPVLPAQVVDQSLGGYCLRWQASMQVRARVGELIGLAFTHEEEEGRRDWMVGVIRWLRYGDDGQVMAGVELLARRACAVGLRATGMDGRARPLMRAIEIDHLDGSGRRCFIASDVINLAGMRVDVVRAPDPERLDEAEAPAPSVEGLQALAQTGEYLLMCSPPQGNREESDHSGD